jgi:MSHA pilin protein MshD
VTPRRNQNLRHNRRLGFTIIEAAVSIAIVGILMTTSLTSMGQIAKARKTQAERRAAYELGQQLMIEIMSQYFQDPGASPVFGPEPGETRATFDDVDDYNGLIESPPTQQNGTAIPDVATGWQRSVAVSYVDPSNPSNVVSSSTLKSVTVTVTAPTGKQYALTAFRSQYGTYEFTPPLQINYVTAVSVNLQAGNSPKYIHTAARPLNETVSQP